MSAVRTEEAPIRRLGVIGDLHGEDQRLDVVIEWFSGQQVDALVCTGDIADGRGCINRSCELLRQGDVRTVAGNHDRWLLNDKVRHVTDAHSKEELSDDNLAYVAELKRQRRLETTNGSLLLCHGAAEDDMARIWPGRKPGEEKRSKALDEVIESKCFRYVINGHMHFRVLIDFVDMTLLNAGTLRGDHAGVSLLDFEGDSVSTYSVSDAAKPERILERQLAPGCDRRIWRDTQEFDGTWTPVTLHA